ncbi:hypothetical protein F5X68DRAFT_230009 [Plectosphaerella plurivora]|uniref:Uncharacterized protein n=1 Tax=Plectosphaerella plurivora TaxID=936078 RepID=A0A9P8VEZ9_9PEZI|nr:hypothetical protein F5X68DRAFT_230009 [Plectosphaerella plurivora]
MGLSSTALMLWQILITNAAQVVISLLYIFYNSIFTRQLVADEWVRFLGEDGKKVLRVSAPNGMQRSTYFLSLPAKYSVPLMAVSSALHWLISQSIYLVQTRAYGPGMSSERIPSRDLTGRGYSVLGAVLALLFGGFLVAVVLINSGVRRYRDIPEGFQLMAYNSSGIQAMCQRPEKDKDASLFPIRMGVTNGPGEGRLGMAVPRLAFSTDINMITPVEGEDYYQPVLEPKGFYDRLRRIASGGLYALGTPYLDMESMRLRTNAKGLGLDTFDNLANDTQEANTEIDIHEGEVQEASQAA